MALQDLSDSLSLSERAQEAANQLIPGAQEVVYVKVYKHIIHLK